MSETIVVCMKDGRNVSFGKRAKCRKEIISDTQIRFDYRNGQTLIFERTRCDTKVLMDLAMHGAKQKIGDEGSDEDTAESYFAKCAAMVDRLYAGTAFERQGGGGFQDGILIEALVQVTGQSRDEVVATLKTCSPEERAALRTEPAIAVAIKRIEAERSKDVAVDDVMKKFLPKVAVEEPAAE